MPGRCRFRAGPRSVSACPVPASDRAFQRAGALFAVLLGQGHSSPLVPEYFICSREYLRMRNGSVCANARLWKDDLLRWTGRDAGKARHQAGHAGCMASELSGSMRQIQCYGDFALLTDARRR
ncbi:hypothetical protein GOD03_15150 [Sinorhizobium medicae]|nr:hypothetical protein [Sinorhizobium medicae]